VFLPEQLESLLSQDYGNLEIIAVDDCSTDNTWQILQKYAGTDKRLVLYQNDYNLGYSRNFEKAISLCKGDYIALSDQDDIWEKDKIGTMMKSVEGHVMIYHNSDFIDDGGNRIGHSTMSSKHRMYEGQSGLPIILGNCIHGHALLFAARLKEYLFPFNEDFSHDWAIAYAAFNIGTVKYIDKVLVHYRQHQHTITDFLERRNDTGTSPERRNLARFGVNVAWLQYCLAFKHKKEPVLTDKACKLFIGLTEGKNKFQNFVFMLRYFDLLFYTIGNKRRSFFSKVNFVRKICFN
jgi:glycosyltransferase involved in cell wall biosynthesis